MRLQPPLQGFKGTMSDSEVVSQELRTCGVTPVRQTLPLRPLSIGLCVVEEHP